MSDVELINPPTFSAMVEELKEQAAKRVKACEGGLLDDRFIDHAEYREAYGRLTATRLMEEDLTVIVGKYERK